MLECQRWGLSPAAIEGLGERLQGFWQRFQEKFRTKTRSEAKGYGLQYLSGLLRMEGKRTFSEIGRQAGVAGQNIEHAMSNSPWSAAGVIKQVQQEIAARVDLQRGGMLLLDESADEKAGEHSAGAARQHNGRRGGVGMSQVGVFLAYSNLTAASPVWTWVDGELFLPEAWFGTDKAQLRARTGIPDERVFATKVQLGWQMIQRVQANGLRFEAVACDSLYGRSFWLRRQLDQAGMVYMADVPANLRVYSTQPVVGLPPRTPGKRSPTTPRVLSAEAPLEVRQVADRAEVVWHRLRVRATERGELDDEFTAQRVWTTIKGETPVAEWLVIRRESDGGYTYALSNAPADTPLQRLA